MALLFMLVVRIQGHFTTSGAQFLRIFLLYDLSTLRSKVTMGKCDNGQQYRRSLQDAKKLYDIANDAGFVLQVVDIGGGFIGTDDIFFESVAAIIRNSITELFSETSVKVKSNQNFYLVLVHCGTGPFLCDNCMQLSN